MNYGLLLIALMTAPVSAADVRVLNIGDACAGVEAKEAALGSKPVRLPQTPPGIAYRFQAQDFDRDFELMYLCPNGHLSTATYFFQYELLDEAAKSFRSVHDRLMNTYGTPFLDSSPWHVRDLAQPAIISSDPSRYFAEWRTARVLAHLSIAPRRKNDGNLGRGWRVALVIGPPKR
jgi:hypothetical protein